MPSVLDCHALERENPHNNRILLASPKGGQAWPPCSNEQKGKNRAVFSLPWSVFQFTSRVVFASSPVQLAWCYKRGGIHHARHLEDSARLGRRDTWSCRGRAVARWWRRWR